MKADGTKRGEGRRGGGRGWGGCTGKKYAQRVEKRKRKQTGSVYRIVKSSTIYTASFKTQMFSTI